MKSSILMQDNVNGGRLAVGRTVSDPLVSDALDFIWSSREGSVKVRQVAGHLKVTSRTLGRHFAEALGHGVLTEIMKCRMHHAKRLLSETSLQVKRVAYLAGFSSTERMRVAFLEHEGVSPKTYREQQEKKLPTPA